MSTHTDGALPSVRPGPAARRAPSGPADPSGSSGPAGSDHAGGHAPADAAGPPRQREPDAVPPSAGGDEAGDEDEPAPMPAEQSGSAWVQQEIARRIAAKGSRDSGRHARPDRRPDGPDEADGDADPSAEDAPPALEEPPPGTADPGSARGVEPYVHTGPASTAEPPFRMAGPAARTETDHGPASGGPGSHDRENGRKGTGTSLNAGWLNGPATNGAVTDPEPGPSPNGTVEEPKQWPPATGAAGLPRRVRGAGWSLDRRALLGETDGEVRDTDTDTRPVPSMWSAAASRGPAVADAGPTTGPPPAEFAGRVVTPADVEDYDDEDDDDGDEDEDEDPRGSATERTAVIWRAPGLDDEPGAATGPSAPATGEPSLHPYTGARPRRFAGATTDAPIEPETAPEPDAVDDDEPDGRRVRIVLSERRAVAHSVRTVVDVQDPGTVGTVLRRTLVSNQFALAVRVGGVALLGLGLLPALFAAFPGFGELAVAGVRLPWLLLGFLVYPFLLSLGWWYVRSAERVEQEFVEDVQDR